MAPLWIDAEGLRERLSMTAAIDALERALREGPPSPAPQRAAVEAGDGTLLVMPATDAAGAAGVKLVTLKPSNPDRGLPLLHGVYVLFSAETLEPVAIFDGGELTGLRTAAVSGLATRHLAAEDASQLVVFGSGVQARSHIAAMRAVRPITHITIVGRRPGMADALVAEVRESGLDATRGEPAAVAEADIVCCCTTAEDPLFAGTLLRDGAHVNAIGSYQLHTREIDTATVTRGKLVVDDIAAVLAEAGDVQIPIAEGALALDQVAVELQAVVAGQSVREASTDITVFKSVGVAWQDLIVAEAAAG